jgi:antirestriction protein ArdC
MSSNNFTAKSAVQFDRLSVTNAAILDRAAQEKGCTCAPYRDWFTYNRWAAQGQQVKKGEHGVRLAIIIEKQTTDAQGKPAVDKHVRHVFVFCKCQVKPIEGGE